MNGLIAMPNSENASVFFYTLSTVGKSMYDIVTITVPFPPLILFGCQTSNGNVFGNASGDVWIGTPGSPQILTSVTWEGNIITGKVYNTDRKAHLVIFG